jgi:putative phosphoesterase
LRVGVLSDSHVNDLMGLPKNAVNLLESMDMILHTGDYTDKRLVDDLRKLGNFQGVHGNMDSFDVKEELPADRVLELNGFRIGVTHPSEGGSPFGLERRIRSKFENVEAIVYGHTHRPKNEVISGVLFFNPGSITGRFPAKHETCGVLKIGNKIEGEIVRL